MGNEPALAGDRFGVRWLDTAFDLIRSSAVRLRPENHSIEGPDHNVQEVFTPLTHYRANETELSGWYRPDLRCAIVQAGRSNAGAHPRSIHRHAARRLASLPE